MSIEVTTGFSGRFTVVAHGGKRGRVVLADQENMILNSGLEYVASGNGSVLTHCRIGFGTTPVAPTDSALVSQFASSTAVQRDFQATATYIPGPPAYKTDFKIWRFATGVAAGNINEIGVGWSASGPTLWSRVVLGSTITVLSDETLDVTYTANVYPPAADVTGTIALGGRTYDYILRAAYTNGGGVGTWNPRDIFGGGLASYSGAVGSFAAYSGGIGAATGLPSGSASSVAGGTLTPAAYVSNSLQRTVEYRSDLSQNNFGSSGCRTLFLYVIGAGGGGTSTHAFQIQFTDQATNGTFGTNLAKDATKVLRLNFTFSLARA